MVIILYALYSRGFRQNRLYPLSAKKLPLPHSSASHYLYITLFTVLYPMSVDRYKIHNIFHNNDD